MQFDVIKEQKDFYRFIHVRPKMKKANLVNDQ